MTQLYDLTLRDHFIGVHFTKGRSAAIREIVLHHNAGHGVDPYDTWQTREASAHCQVWGSGQIDYIVHFEDTAWHAHEANAYSIGLEHEDETLAPDWKIADAGLHASAKLVGYLCAKFGLGSPSYGQNVTTHNAVESDGVGVDSRTACPGPYFMNVLATPGHWYWAEARAAYASVAGATPAGNTSTQIPEEDMPLNDADKQAVAGLIAAAIKPVADVLNTMAQREAVNDAQMLANDASTKTRLVAMAGQLSALGAAVAKLPSDANPADIAAFKSAFAQVLQDIATAAAS